MICTFICVNRAKTEETIETGTLAAAKGGFTAVAAMPNTRPVPDTAEQMEWFVNRLEERASVKVLPYAAITTRQLGKELVDFSALKDAGALLLQMMVLVFKPQVQCMKR